MVTPALELAGEGHPVSASVLRSLPSFAGDQPSEAGQLLVQKDLAHTFRRLVDVEKANGSQGRQAAIRAGP